jgi:hypothetical protein
MRQERTIQATIFEVFAQHESSSQTLICTTASMPRAGARLSPGRGGFGPRFIRPDYRLSPDPSRDPRNPDALPVVG